MTNLNEAQASALEAVTAEKRRYDAKRTELDAQYERDLVRIKADLADVVKAAQEAAVPTRRIAIEGLGTVNVGAVKTILGGSKPRTKSAVKLKADEPDRVLTTPAVHVLDDGIYIVTEPSGDEWEFWGIDIAGQILMERSDSTGRDVHSDVPAPASVIAAIQNAVPRADYSALLDEE